uniref:Pentatricopeptide repeat-containing protein n=1 Tax=Leersia perrieri TaxID=77586 RepID=A0A0D9Y099_9ORYZ
MNKDCIEPNEVTFEAICVLWRKALVTSNLSHEHGIHPRSDHYACVVDIFEQTGKLDRAKKLLRKSNSLHNPDAMVHYVLLSNAYAVTGSGSIGIRSAASVGCSVPPASVLIRVSSPLDPQGIITLDTYHVVTPSPVSVCASSPFDPQQSISLSTYSDISASAAQDECCNLTSAATPA